MSALGFYCAKRLYEKKQIPIGLVLAAQGGSTIESWMPAELLKEFGDFEKIYAPFLGDGVLAKYIAGQEASNAAWRTALESEQDRTFLQAVPEGAEEFTVPEMLLERDGKGYEGIVSGAPYP